MRIRRFLPLLFAVALAGVSAPPTHAQDDAAAPRLERLAKELDLTTAQRTKMREVGEQQLRRGIQERADLEIARLDLRQLMRADKPDQRAIESQIDKLAGMRAQLQKERIAMLLEMRSMLTDVQRAKLRELQATRKIKGPSGLHRMREDSPGDDLPDGPEPPVH